MIASQLRLISSQPGPPVGKQPELGLPRWRRVKNLPASAGGIRDVDSVPALGRSPGVGNGNMLQHSCLKNPMDRGAWWATVHEAAKSQTQLSIHAQPDLGSLWTSLVNWLLLQGQPSALGPPGHPASSSSNVDRTSEMAQQLQIQHGCCPQAIQIGKSRYL